MTHRRLTGQGVECVIYGLMLRRICGLGLFALMCTMSMSCAPAHVAIDYTWADGIRWPGAPEQPRIRYLWGLRQIAGAPKDGSGGEFTAIGGDRESIGYDAHGLPLGSPDFLDTPHGVYVDDNNRLYVTDTGFARVTVVDLTTKLSFDIVGAGRNRFKTPIGVVADRMGRIYVSDSEMRNVSVFDKKGKFQYFLEGEFQRPTGLAINPVDSSLYVSDTWEHVIWHYDAAGRRIGQVGTEAVDEPGHLNYPTHITVDHKGYLYVADTLNFMVQIFSPGGEFYMSFGLVGDSWRSFDKIKGIAVDSDGHIYVTDSAQDMVKIFDREGRLLLFFGEQGHDYGMFFHPAGITIDRRNRIFVADSFNGRVSAFQYVRDTDTEGKGTAPVKVAP